MSIQEQKITEAAVAESGVQSQPDKLTGTAAQNKKVFDALVTAAVVAAIVLVVKIISGAITLISGLFNVILGVIVVLAVIALVIWMFRYAAKHK